MPLRKKKPSRTPRFQIPLRSHLHSRLFLFYILMNTLSQFLLIRQLHLAVLFIPGSIIKLQQSRPTVFQLKQVIKGFYFLFYIFSIGIGWSEFQEIILFLMNKFYFYLFPDRINIPSMVPAISGHSRNPLICCYRQENRKIRGCPENRQL